MSLGAGATAGKPQQPSVPTDPPRLPRAEIFVDGTNFDIAALRLIHSSVDVPKFARELVKHLAEPHLLVKLRYCSAPHPYPQSRSGRFQRSYFEALRQASSVDLILGRHESTGETYEDNNEKIFVEKETDVNVVVQMLQGAYEKRYDTAVIISGDTDMVPAMKAVRTLNKKVVWCHFPDQRGRVDLRKVSDEQFEMDEKFLRPLKYLIVHRR